jgi:DNA-binding NtrC family response regulator
MLEVFGLIQRVSAADLNVLIEGEDGCGRKLVAHFIHQGSGTANKPLVTLDCSLSAPASVEIKLFGDESQRSLSCLERARGGTLLLLFPEELSSTTQAKLTRILEGRARDWNIRSQEVRVISITGRNLARDADDNRFRRSLLDVLCEVRICIPPLRERTEDIPLLVSSLRSELQGNYSPRSAARLEQVLQILGTYSWPGNVRELVTVVKQHLVPRVE